MNTGKKTFTKMTPEGVVTLCNQINTLLARDAYVIRFTASGCNCLDAKSYVGLFGESWLRTGELGKLLKAYIKGLEAGQRSPNLLKKAILLGAELHETSYVQSPDDQFGTYTTPIEDGVQQAVIELGAEAFQPIAEFELKFNWNCALDWAKR